MEVTDPELLDPLVEDVALALGFILGLEPLALPLPCSVGRILEGDGSGNCDEAGDDGPAKMSHPCFFLVVLELLAALKALAVPSVHVLFCIDGTPDENIYMGWKRSSSLGPGLLVLHHDDVLLQHREPCSGRHAKGDHATHAAKGPQEHAPVGEPFRRHVGPHWCRSKANWLAQEELRSSLQDPVRSKTHRMTTLSKQGLSTPMNKTSQCSQHNGHANAQAEHQHR